MRIATAVSAANRLIRPLGLRLDVLSSNGAIPDDVAVYLRPGNPRLRELRRRYAECDQAVTVSRQWHRWTLDRQQLRCFRGDNAYVWQRDGRASLALSARYLMSNDPMGLLDTVTEDGAFGAATEEVERRCFSRDLIDSILELNFLARHLPIATESMSVVDIGAGYGRLAHRACAAFAGLTYACTDAIPASTFLSEFYLKYRASRARVIPLYDFRSPSVDLATNVHSFTECTTAAVNWWLSRLGDVRHLFVVPNAMDHGGTRIINSEGCDLRPLIDAAGYRLLACEPKYADSFVQRYGVQPTYHYLFERH